MKKIWLVVLFLGFTSLCFADVTAEIIGKDIDTNGNIIVKTQYKIDGIEVQSNYPQLGGKYYWVTRYSIQNFANMDATQVQARIDKDIKAYGEQLILKPFREQLRVDLKTANQNLFNGDLLKDIIGHKTTVETATMIIDKNFDGIVDTEIIAKSDGSKIEKDYIIYIIP